MDSLISKVSNQLGFEEQVVRQALGAVLAFLKEQLAGKEFDFDKILSQLHGADQLMRNAEAQKAVRDQQREHNPAQGYTGITGLIITLLQLFGVLEILKRLLKTYFGEKALQMIDTVKDGTQLAVVLKKLGIDRTHGIKMVKMLVDFMKEKVSPETVEQLAEAVPSLQSFLNEGESDKKKKI